MHIATYYTGQINNLILINGCSSWTLDQSKYNNNPSFD